MQFGFHLSLRLRRLAALVMAPLMLIGVAAQAARVPTATELMDWAEARYPQHFPGPAKDQVADPYTYRFYPQSGNYIGVAGTRVYVFGPVAGASSTPVEVGQLSSFACDVYPASCLPGAYPARAISIVVPASAGTALDRLARELAPALQARLGQSVVITNIGGASGVIGTQAVAPTSADGYTLLLHNMGMAMTPLFYRRAPYNPQADFEFLGLIAEGPLVLVGKPNLPPKDYAALAAWLTANGNRVNMGTAGLATPSSVCQMLFVSRTRSPLVSVPYKGTSPLLTDLAGGQIDLACEELGMLAANSFAQRFVRIGVTTAARTTLLGLVETPTLAEQGLAGFDVQQWYGLYAPRGTPPSVLSHLNSVLRQAMTDGEFVRRQQASGLAVVPDSRAGMQAHRDYVNAELTRWAPVVQANGQYFD